MFPLNTLSAAVKAGATSLLVAGSHHTTCCLKGLAHAVGGPAQPWQQHKAARPGDLTRFIQVDPPSDCWPRHDLLILIPHHLAAQPRPAQNSCCTSHGATVCSPADAVLGQGCSSLAVHLARGAVQGVLGSRVPEAIIGHSLGGKTTLELLQQVKSDTAGVRPPTQVIACYSPC